MSIIISLFLSILYLSEVCESRDVQIAQIENVTLKSCGLKSIDSTPPDIHNCFRWHKTFLEERFLSNIYNGKDADDGEFPYTVLLRMVGSLLMSKGSCTGTVLNEQWIITAAHCVDGWSASEIRVYPGITDFPRYLARFSTVAQKFVHANYSDDGEKKYWDIALIKLVRKINRKMFKTNGVCLPGKQFIIMPKELAILSGWGFIDDDTENTYRLKKTLVKLNKLNLDERYFRTTHFINGAFGCRGDSGGPLVQYVNGRAVLIGILRSTEPKKDSKCGRVTGMQFVQIPIHLNWIKDTVLNN